MGKLPLAACHFDSVSSVWVRQFPYCLVAIFGLRCNLPDALHDRPHLAAESAKVAPQGEKDKQDDHHAKDSFVPVRRRSFCINVAR